MKKNILALAFVGSLAMVMIGCGGDDDKKEVKIEDVELVYKTLGTYDLKEYQTPVSNQINNYEEKTYKNNKGKKSYPAEPVKTDNHIYKYEVNATAVKEIINSTLDSTYIYNNDRITILYADDNTSEDFVRFVEKGDYIYKKVFEGKNNGLDVEISMLCKVDSHINTMDVNGDTYNDIIKISCINKGSAIGKVNGDDYSNKANGTSVVYIAKDIGEISSADEDCETTKLNDIVTSSSCEKEIIEITGYTEI